LGLPPREGFTYLTRRSSRRPGRPPSSRAVSEKEGSVAPKERVNITYKPAIGDAKRGSRAAEAPHAERLFDEADPRPLEDRKPLNVDKDNFQKVMAEQKLQPQLQREERAVGEP
jgi:type VI secretion system ImpB/VipA family protein